MRIENCQKAIITCQLTDLFSETCERIVSSSNFYSLTEIFTFLLFLCLKSLGYLIEPNKRLIASKRQPGKRTIKGNTICNQCLTSIVRTPKMAEPLIIF